MKKIGIVFPMGQNKKLLEKSGQWNLWEQELRLYKQSFERVEIFEYQHNGIRRFPEALCMPIRERKRWISCHIFKAVHLTGSVPCVIGTCLYKTPYIFSYGYRYDQFATLERKWGQWLLVKILTPFVVRYAKSIIVPTKELKQYVERIGGKNIVVIPNGVDINLFKGRSLQFKGPSLRRNFVILFVGRLEKQKNLEVLVRALHEISKGPTLQSHGRTFIRLIFVGNGSFKYKLLYLAEKLNVYIEIKNPLPNDQLPKIYQQADIFVLPSLVEGHPKALLEAMSCGLACLASDISGVNEILVNGKNGLLIKPTIANIAQGLKKLMENDDLRRRLGVEARKTIEAKFDKNSLMKREIKLFQAFKGPSSRKQGRSL